LIAAIRLALEMPSATSETYIAADPDPLTLAEIIVALRAAEHRKPMLVPVPPFMFDSVFKALGRGEDWDRISGGLVADPSKLIRAGWKPPVVTRAGLAAMVQATSPRKSGTASRNTR